MMDNVVNNNPVRTSSPLSSCSEASRISSSQPLSLLREDVILRNSFRDIFRFLFHNIVDIFLKHFISKIGSKYYLLETEREITFNVQCCLYLYNILKTKLVMVILILLVWRRVGMTMRMTTTPKVYKEPLADNFFDSFVDVQEAIPVCSVGCWRGMAGTTGWGLTRRTLPSRIMS